MIISHINHWDQLNFWKNFWKFWNGPLCRNKSDPSLLLNVAVYWQSSNTEACAKKLSQILVNNINNDERGIGLRIYVRCCRFRLILWNLVHISISIKFCNQIATNNGKRFTEQFFRKKYLLRYYLKLISWAELLFYFHIFSFSFFYFLRYQKALSNPQFRGLKNTLDKVGTTNLKIYKWMKRRKLTQNQFQK